MAGYGYGYGGGNNLLAPWLSSMGQSSLAQPAMPITQARAPLVLPQTPNLTYLDSTPTPAYRGAVGGAGAGAGQGSGTGLLAGLINRFAPSTQPDDPDAVVNLPDPSLATGGPLGLINRFASMFGGGGGGDGQ